MDKKRRALRDQGTTLEHRTQVNSGRNTKPAGGLGSWYNDIIFEI